MLRYTLAAHIPFLSVPRAGVTPTPRSGDAGTDCVVCGAAALGRPAVRIRQAVLRPCRTCGSWTYLPRPTQSELTSYHDEADYFAHPYFQLRREAILATEARCRQTFQRIQRAAPALRLDGAKALDVGCDVGLFVAASARLFRTEPFGVDVSSRAVNEAARRGVDAHLGTLDSAPPRFSHFDVITAIDLIEHVADPADLFSAIHDRLRPGGVAYVETPNTRSAIYVIGRVVSGLTGGRPRGAMDRLFPPEHVQYYSKAGLAAVATRAGLEVISAATRRLPMPDIAVDVPLKIALGAAQGADLLTGEAALLWGVLRRPL